MRTTQKQVDGAVERLSEIMGVELVINQWHQHVSVYTKGPSDSCQELIAQSNTKKDFVDQVYAAIRALEIKSKKG